MAMITSISWIPKGSCNPVPLVAAPSSKEEDKILASGAISSDDDSDIMDMDEAVDDEVSQALAVAASLTDRSGTVDGTGVDDIDKELKKLEMDKYDDEDGGVEIFSNSGTFYRDPDQDPYPYYVDSEDSEDEEDMTIKMTDSVIVCAKNDDDVSELEVWILEELEDGTLNQYVHHSIMLPAFPLCTAWLDCDLKNGVKGNFIAVGSMETAIEIWDLDLLDEVQPFVVLGGLSKEKKVQAVDWSRHSPDILLSGSFDHSVIMMDVRSSEKPSNRWSVTADVESLSWNPHYEHSFVFLATGSTDKKVKLWDLSNNQPSCLGSRKPKTMFLLFHFSQDGCCFLNFFLRGEPFLTSYWRFQGEAGNMGY